MRDPHKIRIFLWLAQRVSSGLGHELKHLGTRLHLQLDGAGDYGICFERGRVRVRPGAPAAATAVVGLPAGLFVDLCGGRAHFVTAQLTGQIRAQGEGHGPLIVGALFSHLHAAARERGLRGWAARSLVRWFHQGASR